jgi:membrane protein DedA with SNARE-associated domain
MTETIHLLIEKYGLLAVFIGCMAEGESVAILGGFFVHQSVFAAWQAFTAAFLGAFAGDILFFVLGRSFYDHPFLLRIRSRPGFGHAHRLVIAHPNLFVLSNRYIYGLRLVGGIAAGFSGISVSRFLMLNAVSSFVWAALFITIGYVFGLGAERIIGQELLKHERLLVALAAGMAVTIVAGLLAHHIAKKERSKH